MRNNPKTPPCQRILDEQGYLILCSPYQHSMGEVIPDANGGRGWARVPGPLVVIGFTDKKEWLQQAKRYADESIVLSYPDSHYSFIKVIAE